LMLTKRGDNKHRKMEREVLTSADRLVTVSWNWAKDFKGLGAKNIHAITNGFDHDDFKNITYTKSEKFELIHLGSFNKDRNPLQLWEALGELCQQDEKFRNSLKITLIGQTDFSIFETLEKHKLTSFVNKISYKPHDEVLTIAGNASVLLLPLNDTPHVSGIVPGKIFEYIALKRPILCIGTVNGDSARIITECKAGTIAGFKDKKAIKSALEVFFTEYISGTDKMELRPEVALYSRKTLSGKIASILNEISENGVKKN